MCPTFHCNITVQFTFNCVICAVQCRSYSEKSVNQLFIYSSVLGAAIKCEHYSEITVESGTHVKPVKITLSIFAVQLNTKEYSFQTCFTYKTLFKTFFKL